MVSLATKSSAALENGGRNVLGSLSNRSGFECDSWPGDSALAICPRQCRLQCLDGRSADLGGDAAGYGRPARMAASRRTESMKPPASKCMVSPQPQCDRGTRFPVCGPGSDTQFAAKTAPAALDTLVVGDSRIANGPHEEEEIGP